MTIPGDQIPKSGERGNDLLMLWHKLVDPRAKKEDEAQREHVVKVILIFLELVICLFLLIAIIGWLKQKIPLDTIIILAIMFVLFFAGWLMAHYGHWWIGGMIPCLIMFSSAVYGNYIGGIDAPAMLLYALAIVMAAIMLGSRAQIVVLILSMIAFFGMGLAHNSGYLTSTRNAGNMFANRISIVFAALAAISLGVWFLKNQYQRSINQARAYAESTRAVFETVIDGIVFTDLNGKILDLNEALQQMFLLENREQALGHSVDEFIFSEDQEQTSNFRQKVLSESYSGTFHCKGLQSNGNRIDIEINSATFLDSQGNVRGYVSSIRDITQRKRVEEELARHREHLEELVVERTAELKEAYNELESFSYSVSHDLRSPLRRIEGFVNILSDDYKDTMPEQSLPYLQRIVDSTHRMTELINDLLNFSRLIRQPVSNQLVHPDEIVRSVVDELLGSDLSRQTMEIMIEDMPSCNADPVLLRQVYFNLLDNAIKYSHKKEKALIIVGANQDNKEHVIYYVRDNGVGFDMQYANRLFGVFQRLHSEKEYEGTGIGLATVQRIIRRHNGKIWAESTVNQGTTFYFMLNNRNPS